jgi:hypothetical protein
MCVNLKYTELTKLVLKIMPQQIPKRLYVISLQIMLRISTDWQDGCTYHDAVLVY